MQLVDEIFVVSINSLKQLLLPMTTSDATTTNSTINNNTNTSGGIAIDEVLQGESLTSEIEIQCLVCIERLHKARIEFLLWLELLSVNNTHCNSCNSSNNNTKDSNNINVNDIQNLISNVLWSELIIKLPSIPTTHNISNTTKSSFPGFPVFLETQNPVVKIPSRSYVLNSVYFGLQDFPLSGCLLYNLINYEYSQPKGFNRLRKYAKVKYTILYYTILYYII